MPVLKLHRKVRHHRLPTNVRGRDFVVGDLHGHFKSLMRLLRTVKFSPAKGDRLFSVGDLTDRGPASRKCLRLLNRSWFYSVLGNHDIALVINLLAPSNVSRMERIFYVRMAEDGGQWYLAESAGNLAPLMRKLADRPHLLTVGGDRPLFHIVHASLHPFEKSYTPLLILDKDMGLYKMAKNQILLIDSLVGERGLWDGMRRERTPGLAPTFCGHTPQPVVTWSLGHLNLDTGAGYGDKLTLTCVQTGRFWSTRAGDAHKETWSFLPQDKRRPAKARRTREGRVICEAS